MSTDLSVNDEKSIALARPNFMSADAGSGVEELTKFVIPPRIKVVQKQSSDDLQAKFEKGSVIITPQQFLVAGMDDDGKPEPFYLTPLFFFPEWLTINPIQTKGQLPMIRERSTDPRSVVAQKARNPARRLETCPEKQEFKMKHTEALNFFVVLYGDNDAAGIPVVLSFSRGEHGRGGNFATLLKQRCARSQTPIYGLVFRAQVGHRSNQQGAWYGIDVSNLSQSDIDAGIQPFVADEETYKRFKENHLLVKSQYEANLIQVSHDDENIIDEPQDSDEF